MSLHLEVECYSGYKADERPLRFRFAGRPGEKAIEVKVLHYLLDLADIGLRVGDEDALFPGFLRDGHFFPFPRSVPDDLYYSTPRTLSPASPSSFRRRRSQIRRTAHSSTVTAALRLLSANLNQLGWH